MSQQKPDVRVVFCPVGQAPEILEIPSHSNRLEELVGIDSHEHLDVLRVLGDVDLFFNNAALTEGRPPNRNVPGHGFIHGPFVLTCSTEDGDLISFTPERAAAMVVLVDSWQTLPGSYPGRGRGPS